MFNTISGGMTEREYAVLKATRETDDGWAVSPAEVLRTLKRTQPGWDHCSASVIVDALRRLHSKGYIDIMPMDGEIPLYKACKIRGRREG